MKKTDHMQTPVPPDQIQENQISDLPRIDSQSESVPEIPETLDVQTQEASAPAVELALPPSGDLPAAKKNSHLFPPGVSGNPSGRPKRTKAEKDALEAIRSLAPDAAKKLKDILEDNNVSLALKIKVIEIILDRTYGKSETAVKVNSVAETIQQSEAYIMALVAKVREGM